MSQSENHLEIQHSENKTSKMMQTNLWFLKCFLTLLLELYVLCGAMTHGTAHAAAKRPALQKPNFVLIVADDLGYGDLSLTGSTQISTPHIDALAQSGFFFPQGYVSSAVCSPSRAGFMTGINGVEFGYDNNMGGITPGSDGRFLGLPVAQKTIASLLKPAGYVSGLIGKWHLGDAEQFAPTKRGFDEFWGFRGGGHDYFQAAPDGKGYSAPIECNYKKSQPLTYITDDMGDESVDFIKRHKEQPFFFVCFVQRAARADASHRSRFKIVRLY